MSIRAMNAVWESSPAKGAARLVMLSLADRADENGYCWPSLSTLEKKTLLTRRGVTTALATLIKDGELLRDRAGHTSNDGRATTAYWIMPGGVRLGTRERGSLGKKVPSTREQNDAGLGNKLPLDPSIDTSSDPSVRSRPRASMKTDPVAAAEWLVQLWNEKAGQGVPTVLSVSKTRQRLAQGAWRGHPDPAWWRAALARAHRSRFLLGGKGGWRMNFDWFVRGDNAQRVTEGVHDNHEGDFRAEYEKAQTIINRAGGHCSHDPMCADREEHLERVVDRILGLTVDTAAPVE